MGNGISDAGCRANTLGCSLWFSDSGILRIPHDIFPAADSSFGFHDAGNYPSWATQITIPSYFAVNIIGAVGTFFDVPNWNQNFVDPNTYIFKRVEAEPFQNTNQFQNLTRSNILNQN